MTIKVFLITVIASLFFTSCLSKRKKSEKVQKSEYITCSDAIYKYGDPACRKFKEETKQIVLLKKDTINQGELLEGEIFFNNDNLRKLASCNNLDYQIKLLQRNYATDSIFTIVEKLKDTIHFAFKPTWLKKIKENKRYSIYECQLSLIAQYYKLNKVSGCDTVLGFYRNTIYLKR